MLLSQFFCDKSDYDTIKNKFITKHYYKTLYNSQTATKLKECHYVLFSNGAIRKVFSINKNWCPTGFKCFTVFPAVDYIEAFNDYFELFTGERGNFRIACNPVCILHKTKNL